MQLAYTYTAKTSTGQVLKGIVYGPNKPLAASKLKKNGFRPVQMDFTLVGTISNFLKPDFDAVELSRFYNTIGRRLERGKPMAEGLDTALEYVKDERLRGAILILKQCVLDGQSQFQALQAAGFPRRDTMVIRSTEEAGSTGAAYTSLAKEVQRSYQLRASIKSVFYLPIAMSVFMIFFVWAAISFIAPLTMNFLSQTGAKGAMNPAIQFYFDFAKTFNSAHILSSVLYFGAFIAFALFVRSAQFKKLLDQVPFMKKMSIKGDHAALWGNYALLYDAAVPAKEAARIVAEAAMRQDSKQAFQRMAKLVEGGRDVAEAVGSSGFPSFVVSGVKSAVSGGDLKEGLVDMSMNLEEEVSTMTTLLKENVKILSTVLVATGVFLVFLVTYYPILASVLSQF
jgi:type II secretory pathway component PulF